MTRVSEITMIENCLDSSRVVQFELDNLVTESIMYAISKQGALKYYPDFPRPYFRIERAFHYIVQGVLGNSSLRVTFSPRADVNDELELIKMIEEK